uniref:Uncharacterized protein n=1 Tax=viral metagenome TaxID=1070528 RepID=A0A6H1ZEH6_9ZZZZ
MMSQIARLFGYRTGKTDGDWKEIEADNSGRLFVRQDSYSPSTQSNRIEEVDPLDTRDVLLVDQLDSNIPNGTPATIYVDIKHRKRVMVDVICASADDTFNSTYALSLQDDGTAPASCNYQDISSYLDNDGSSKDWLLSGVRTSTHLMMLPHGVTGKYLRITHTTAGGVGSGDATTRVMAGSNV